jgi:hypothetical protein
MNKFVGIEARGTRPLDADIRSLIVAGWTGRDAHAVEHHIRELESIGVRRPTNVPTYYRVAAGNLTDASRIEVAGRQSTGEVEVVLVRIAGELWVGVGSDHTDRELEKQSVSLSKQICAKPMAPSLWRFDDVADHWDTLELRSNALIGGERRPYQRGAVSAMRRPDNLIGEFCRVANLANGELPEGAAMFCGTLPVLGKLEFAERFEFELHDPLLERSIRHAYDIEELPLAD